MTMTTKHNEEDVLCLSALLASKTLPEDAGFQEAEDYFQSLNAGCDSCLLQERCLACIINESGYPA
jgi:hypothetical protein